MIVAMVFSGASAFAMSYASAWCVRTTSSTTYSMVGALNKLPIAASGIMFFGDPATFGNVTAIIVGKSIWFLRNLTLTNIKKKVLLPV
jgi:GDP-mannose transporter